jgi:hypothetical protein
LLTQTGCTSLRHARRQHQSRSAASLRVGQRAAAMDLIHSARLTGHDVYAYFKDVLERLLSQSANRVGELFPHRWSPP